MKQVELDDVMQVSVIGLTLADFAKLYKTFLSDGRKPEVKFSHARTVVSSRFSN